MTKVETVAKAMLCHRGMDGMTCADCPYCHLSQGMCGCSDQMYADILELLEQVPRWRAADDPPETDEHVLCCTVTKKGQTNKVIGYYMEGAWRCGMNSNVVGWMPLPEDPDE